MKSWVLQLEKHNKTSEKIYLEDTTKEMKFIVEQSLLDEEDRDQA